MEEKTYTDKPMSPTETRLEYLAREIGELEETALNLERRLSIILQPSAQALGATPIGSATEQPQSEMVNKLDAFAGRVNNVCRKLREVTANLDI